MISLYFFNLFLILNRVSFNGNPYFLSQKKTTFSFIKAITIKTVKKIFEHLVSIPDSEWKMIAQYFTEQEVPNKGFLLREGQIARETFLIKKGCCRSFYNFDGVEKNISFSRENCWQTDIDSFFNHKPSTTYIQAIEPSTVLGLTHTNKKKLFAYHQGFESYFRILAEKKVTFLLEIMGKRNNLDAKERFIALKKRQPWVFQRIPQYHIASFLGISPTSFSLIQKEIAQTV
ncbi:Crp/Fnr family transcriptional regulator [Aquimarina aquimarini]|uniref:Crp/Fnr family transcriptional regulator n=1 Tax=Aquimarina aquimarini TaxID=1191734 RepID=UPI00131F0EA1|nr:hypothetical protein [Aquimarina aquimarini]